jgi:hypothetical protein
MCVCECRHVTFVSGCTVCVEGGGDSVCVHVRETSKGYLDQYKGEFEFHHFLKHPCVL